MASAGKAAAAAGSMPYGATRSYVLNVLGSATATLLKATVASDAAVERQKRARSSALGERHGHSLGEILHASTAGSRAMYSTASAPLRVKSSDMCSANVPQQNSPRSPPNRDSSCGQTALPAAWLPKRKAALSASCTPT